MGDEIENANVIRVECLPPLDDYPHPEWCASIGPDGAGAIHAVSLTPAGAVRKLLERLPESWPWDESWRPST